MNRKYLLLGFILFMLLGVSTAIMAQTHHKKKHKKTKAELQAQADSIAAQHTKDSLAQAAAMAPPPPAPAAEPVDTGHQLTDGLVADTSYMDYAHIDLDTSKPVDGYYKTPLLRGARPFAFPKQNKYNIKFYKRIWRTIDLMDSANRIYSMPGQTLMAIIMSAIQAQKLVAYSDETFTRALTYDKVQRAMSDSVVVPEIDSTGVQYGSHMLFVPFNPDSVATLEIKEDIFVDKVRGRMITQIIGMSPVKKVKGSSGDVIGESHPFWLYFPQCRNVFASKEAFDVQTHSDDVLSYDDLFIQRNFKSVIVKESNPADMRIRDKYTDPAKQKQEADRIEKEIQDYKNKLWKY